MGYIKPADYEQVQLFPVTLEELLARDHSARFLREFVDVVLASGDLDLRRCEGKVGHPSYPPDVLLRIWLYGYYKRIVSTRALEEACRVRIDFMWLAGMLQPDHNTLWRFFKANKKTLRSLFTCTIKAALKEGCVGFVLHALDGTRIQSQSATRSGWHQGTLEAQLARLEDEITALEQAIEEAGEKALLPDDALPEALTDAQAMRARLNANYAELKGKGLKHHHPQEPEARIMKCQDRGKKLFGYNAQAVADEASGLIVAADVVNEENDFEQLVPMLDQAKENLGKTPDLTVADKGYANCTAMQEAQAKNLHACVHLPKHYAEPTEEGSYHSSQFTYDAESDTCICPRGEHLPYAGDRRHKRRGYTVRLYRCHCSDCPVRAQCTKEKGGRVIEVAPYHEALTHQRKLQKTDAGRDALRKRKHIIETVFAQIKEHYRFRRWTLRGLENVRAQWSLVCTAYNLRKLYARWREKQAPKGPNNSRNTLKPAAEPMASTMTNPGTSKTAPVTLPTLTSMKNHTALAAIL